MVIRTVVVTIPRGTSVIDQLKGSPQSSIPGDNEASLGGTVGVVLGYRYCPMCEGCVPWPDVL